MLQKSLHNPRRALIQINIDSHKHLTWSSENVRINPLPTFYFSTTKYTNNAKNHEWVEFEDMFISGCNEIVFKYAVLLKSWCGKNIRIGSHNTKCQAIYMLLAYVVIDYHFCEEQSKVDPEHFYSLIRSPFLAMGLDLE